MINESDIVEMRQELERLYPKEFLEKYCIIEALSNEDSYKNSETFLAVGRKDQKKYIVKRFERSPRASLVEVSMMAGLSHKGLPRYTDSYENDSLLLSVREYVEGLPLDSFAGGRKLPESHAVSICGQLCDVLTYLHSQPTPIIHRDIKPQNIIITPDERVVLIDFDIARTFDPDKKADTNVFGTLDYAPPEQYGFSQTDCRSDIYAMGVLLKRMVSGSEKLTENCGDISKPLMDVIEKCTAFSPNDRYDSAQEVKNALAELKRSGARRTAAHRIAAYIIVPLLCLLTFGAGLLLGRSLPGPQEDAAPAASPADASGNDAGGEPAAGIVFREPLIEQSVRMQVGKTNGEELTESDLRSITGVYVDGDVALDSYDAFADHPFEGAYGNITTLEDIRMLPCAYNIAVNHQPLSDISCLENLMNIKHLWLSDNNVSDFSVLASTPNLESVFISNTKIEDASVFDELAHLRDVYLAQTTVPPEKIGGRKSIKLLCLNDRHFDSFEGLVGFDRLERLIINNETTANCSFEPLLELPSLKVIETNQELAEELKNTFKGTDVEIIVI